MCHRLSGISRGWQFSEWARITNSGGNTRGESTGSTIATDNEGLNAALSGHSVARRCPDRLLGPMSDSQQTSRRGSSPVKSAFERSSLAFGCGHGRFACGNLWPVLSSQLLPNSQPAHSSQVPSFQAATIQIPSQPVFRHSFKRPNRQCPGAGHHRQNSGFARRGTPDWVLAFVVLNPRTDKEIPFDQRFWRHTAKCRDAMIRGRKPAIRPERRLLEVCGSGPAAGAVWWSEDRSSRS